MTSHSPSGPQAGTLPPACAPDASAPAAAHGGSAAAPHSHGADYKAAPILFMGPHRIGQFLRVSLVAVGVAVVFAFFSEDAETTTVLCAVEGALLMALRLTALGRTAYATWLMLVATTLVLCYQAYASAGLRDEVIVAFPCLLIFASMFGTRRHYAWVLAIVIATLALITAGNVMGWHRNDPQPTSWLVFVNLLCILSVTAYLVWLMASDLRLTMARLKQENDRILDSHARIDRLAHHDALTGLPNRMLARQRVEQAIAQARRGRHSVAVIFMDLDNFKSINDSLGHSAADRLLCEVANRLCGLVRAGDTVSRQGGDEFLIVLANVANPQEAAQTATRIVEGLARPVLVDGVPTSVTCSLGIALHPKNAGDFEELLRIADMAMYRAKEGGRNTFRFCEVHDGGSSEATGSLPPEPAAAVT